MTTQTQDPYAGAPADDTTRARDFPVQGNDVSEHQGPNFDWDAAIAAGCQFGVTRITIGSAPTVDIRAAENWAALFDRRDQVVRGAYHYAYPASIKTTPEADAIEEAHWFCDTFEQLEADVHDGPPGWDGRCLPPSMDYEQTADNTANKPDKLTLTVEEQKTWVNHWIWTVQDRTKRGVIVYSGPNVWAANFDRDDWITDIPLWVAQYTSPSGRSIKPWASWLIWQWSGGGNGDNYQSIHGHPFPGASNGGSVDVDAFWGTPEQLGQLCDPRFDRWLNRDGTVGANPHAAAVPPVSPSPAPAPTRGPVMAYLDLAVGQDWSLDVARVQALLVALGFAIAIDGALGPDTRAAYAEFSGGSLVVDWLELLGRQ